MNNLLGAVLSGAPLATPLSQFDIFTASASTLSSVHGMEHIFYTQEAVLTDWCLCRYRQYSDRSQWH
ncbi:hypothetical protein CY34DRAFT_812311 [Suillus luteus UH-Slu-Lm8-n1]|uniref:Uncharacterized protein n=1 Tax=Suillus luteus UH-Slu-Lm8-n1 TaxID=930992 RepID=A0A0D0AAZ1_9AGAM|nr:hypothetical protein CY34DRAFT_812311 [Suillus luteus UH-Slu-Lm8-n1]